MIRSKQTLHFICIQITLLMVSAQIIAKNQNTTKSLEKIAIITKMLQNRTTLNLKNIIEITKLLYKQQEPERKAKKTLKKKISAKRRNNILIQNINFQPNELNEKGHPTPQALEKILIKEYFPRFHQNITVERFNGGNINEALYRVFDKKNKEKGIFFLKISPLYDIVSDAEKLEILQQSSVGRLGLDTFYYPDSKKVIPKKELPRLIWIDRFWIYKNQYHQEKIIEVTHAAHGSTVFNTLQSKDQDLKNKCVQALGSALASFQQAFMICLDQNDPASWLTMAHQDLHSGNVLFDPKTSRIYFIDNANMQASKTLLYDLEMLYYFISDRPLRTLFLNSYINAYPENKQKLITNFIAINFKDYPRIPNILKN